ncbi:MAG: SAM-dependent methyltransferase [Planctomycetia bacterium]|nr:SAM-dependent methyltransferase [Planctomycetia bacterium]
MDRQSKADRNRPAFLFVTCQVGAEPALKSEYARLWPAFRCGYSRPGFLTFKLPGDHDLAPDFDPQSVFARTCGFSLGKATAANLEERVKQVWMAAGDRTYDALHIWQRDMAPAGFHGFDPHITPAACEAEAIIRRFWPDHAGGNPLEPARIARPGQTVLDCVLVEPNEWWIGYHQAASEESCFPGGLRDIALPTDAVSRAYLKMEEALEWSGLPIRRGQRFVEIGCAPGGSSQSLLAHGLTVIGIDPAQVDPRVLAHPNFTHLHKRGADVRRREFRGVTWLAADMNVAPQYTLDTVEAIVTHPTVSIRGLLLTLKLVEWELAEQIPEYLARVRAWGFSDARAKQLAHNRQEICVRALKRETSQKGSRRVPVKRSGRRRQN